MSDVICDVMLPLSLWFHRQCNEVTLLHTSGCYADTNISAFPPYWKLAVSAMNYYICNNEHQDE